jgi:hypothetical protein
MIATTVNNSIIVKPRRGETRIDKGRAKDMATVLPEETSQIEKTTKSEDNADEIMQRGQYSRDKARARDHDS